MTDLTISITLLAVIFAMVAFFYASVGLGGGSSYTALLAIFGATTVTIPMVSLTLNVLVTTVGSIIFLSQRHARLRLIAPFLISSVPMAYVWDWAQQRKLQHAVLFSSGSIRWQGWQLVYSTTALILTPICL